MKLIAALKQRLAFIAEIGFCSAKFAPIWNACWVVVLPFRMAKVAEFLLLALLRKLASTSKPPLRSSQSTMTASNFSVRRISWPEPIPRQTSTSMESFSKAGWRTRMTSGSRLRSSDSNRIRFNGSFPVRLLESDQSKGVIFSNCRAGLKARVLDVLFPSGIRCLGRIATRFHQETAGRGPGYLVARFQGWERDGQGTVARKVIQRRAEPPVEHRISSSH